MLIQLSCKVDTALPRHSYVNGFLSARHIRHMYRTMCIIFRAGQHGIYMLHFDWNIPLVFSRYGKDNFVIMNTDLRSVS